MQEALDAGMQSPDPAVQAEWRRIPHKGAKSTPQEVMDYMANKIKADRLN